MTELIDPCGAVCLSNGCAPPSDRCCLPSRCFYCEARPRNVPHCLPKVTHSSAIMRYTQHREASVSFPPSHGESLLSAFLHASYTRHKLLNPRNTVLWDSAGAILQGQWGWIWHIWLCWTQLPSAWIRREREGVGGGGGGGGKYSRRACRFSGLATSVWETKKGT